MKTLTRKQVEVFYRPVWVEILHRNLTHNFSVLSSVVPSSVTLLSVVKANAYGHGLVSVSKTLSECGSGYFGVSSVEEALALRNSGIKKSILILGSIFPFESLEPVIQEKIHVTIASLESAQMCEKAAKKTGKKIHAHAKIDTGMNRIGVQAENGFEFIRKIMASPSIVLDGLYTHFSNSAEDRQFTEKQIEIFSSFAASLKKVKITIPYVHCANSAALIKYPASHFSMVRPGIALYGVNPSRNSSVEQNKLKPALSWKSRIVFLKNVSPNTPISYLGTFRAKRKSKIATAAFGYADGYRRILSNRGQVLVKGKRVPVVGRITMDMTMLDVTDLPEVAVGDEVTLIGAQGKENILAEDVAEWAETSPYEIFCGIASRVPRVNIY